MEVTVLERALAIALQACARTNGCQRITASHNNIIQLVDGRSGVAKASQKNNKCQWCKSVRCLCINVEEVKAALAMPAVTLGAVLRQKHSPAQLKGYVVPPVRH